VVVKFGPAYFYVSALSGVRKAYMQQLILYARTHFKIALRHRLLDSFVEDAGDDFILTIYHFYLLFLRSMQQNPPSIP
jgi:hypothetical protein